MSVKVRRATMGSSRTTELLTLLGTIGLALSLSGCGTIKGSTATDQLLVSDAVDKSVEQVRFDELSGKRVFLDTTYLKPVRSVGFVNTEYIVSSLREHMLRSGCRLQDQRGDADYVLEVRVGALGTDAHEVNYGLPGSQALNQTASLLASNTPMPTIPEISLAKRSERRAAAKIALFAYHRETKEPIWQTGTVQGVSLAKSTWVLGAGPFQEGMIYDLSDLATSPIDLSADQPVLAAVQRPLQQLAQSLTPTTSKEDTMLTQLTAPPQLQPVPHAGVGNDDPEVARVSAILPLEPPSAARPSTQPVVQPPARSASDVVVELPHWGDDLGDVDAWLRPHFLRAND